MHKMESLLGDFFVDFDPMFVGGAKAGCNLVTFLANEIAELLQVTDTDH